MTKRVAAKYKISRRIGKSLWGRGKDPVNKREYAPGQHGAGKRRKTSDYGLQLKAKQTLKGYYGNITERQFRKIYAEASRRRGDTGENLIGILESRLDAFVYRMGVVPTVFAARQFVSHGHVQVNGKRVTISSYQMKAGDEVTVREKSRDLAIVQESIQSAERTTPDYIDFDSKALKAKYVRVPQLAEVPFPIVVEPNLVVEFYSR